MLRLERQENLGDWVISWIADGATEGRSDRLHKLAAAIGECEQGILNKHGKGGLREQVDPFIQALIDAERLSTREAVVIRARRLVARQKYYNLQPQPRSNRIIPSISAATRNWSAERLVTDEDFTVSYAGSAGASSR